MKNIAKAVKKIKLLRLVFSKVCEIKKRKNNKAENNRILNLENILNNF